MKVGINTATELKDISMERGVAFADLLHAYVIEDLVRRIYESSYADHFLFLQEKGESLADIALHTEERMDFFYIKSEKQIAPDKLIPGQVLSEKLLQQMASEVFDKANKYSVDWNYQIAEEKEFCRIQLIAQYKEMSVPVNLRITEMKEQGVRSVKQEIPMILKPSKTVFYYSYSPENLIGEHLFEIVRKLELIGDMKSYCVVNDILRTQSVSGRYIMEELQKFAEKEPKVIKPKRMEQLAEYREYTYMRKRWEQYCKSHGKEVEPWMEVIDRLMNFLQPLWNCLCNNEIFFDDWMPELGRFLG